MERALFEKHLFSLDKPSNIVHLETSLFELGSLPKVVSGVFTCYQSTVMANCLFGKLSFYI